LDVVVLVGFHAELPFEITGKNRPKWLEFKVQIALVFLLV